MTDRGRELQTNLPGGAPLAPGEAVVVADRFMLSTVAFYMHMDLALTNRRLYAVRPNTMFGLIPVGTGRSNFPVENIAGVNAGTRFDLLGVIFGVAAVIFGLGALAIPSAGILGLVLLVLGVGSIVNSPKQYIAVMNSGGGSIHFPVSVLERGQTLEFANRVAEAIARTTKGGVVAEAMAQPRVDPADPGDALRNLQRLHDQGLITEAEFAAKRSEILTRL